jgi:hypothetical protein
MKVSPCILAAVLGIGFALPAGAQYIGVLQSAETMDRGTFKLMVAPILAFGKHGADNEFGVAARGGYGFTDRFDAEAKLGFFENGTYFGADGELWILKGPEKDAGLDFSVAGGVHWMFGKDGTSDAVGLDVTPLLSGHVTENLELCVALDASLESISDAPDASRVHLVPGIEYRLSEAADVVGEIGIGLNDDSFTYAGVGVSFYLW